MNAPLTWGQVARTLAVEFAERAVAHDRDGVFRTRTLPTCSRPACWRWPRRARWAGRARQPRNWAR